MEPLYTIYQIRFTRGRRGLMMNYDNEIEALAAVETLKEFPGVTWVNLQRLDSLIEWRAEGGTKAPVDMHEHCVKENTPRLEKG